MPARANGRLRFVNTRGCECDSVGCASRPASTIRWRPPHGRRTIPERPQTGRDIEAASLTSSACRLHPVLSNTRSRWVLTVLGAMPSNTAMSDNV